MPETGKYGEAVEAYQRIIRQDWTDGDNELLEKNSARWRKVVVAALLS